MFFKTSILNLFVFSFLILFCSNVLCKNIKVKIIKIIDGDTVVARTINNKKLKIRLAGIDAPERDQPYGIKSTNYLKKIIFSKIVNIHLTSKDKYKRSLGIIFYKKTNINLDLVSSGNAWAYRKYLKKMGKKLEEAFIRAESNAQYYKLGLWNNLSPTPPWTWRKNNKK